MSRYSPSGEAARAHSPGALFQDLARRYIWWQDSSGAEPDIDRIVAQVMNIGDWDDVLRLEQYVRRDRLIRVLRTAAPGILSPKSWAFWHYRLGLVPAADPVPPMKTRAF
ncbi:MAG: hypothetical protein M1314_02815 [Firmicutes bacterium]|nr:hypothetical protein [Bacillota bacterium]